MSPTWVGFFAPLKYTEAKMSHSLKDSLPIEVTELPIVNEVNFIHLWNALLSIEITESGIVINVNLEQV